jgi:hypothetical protein
MDENHPNYLATYEPVNHGFKFDFRLEHLTVRDVVIVTCPECNHQYKVAPHVFLSRYRELSNVGKTISLWKSCAFIILPLHLSLLPNIRQQEKQVLHHYTIVRTTGA